MIQIIKTKFMTKLAQAQGELEKTKLKNELRHARFKREIAEESLELEKKHMDNIERGDQLEQSRENRQFNGQKTHISIDNLQIQNDKARIENEILQSGADCRKQLLENGHLAQYVILDSETSDTVKLRVLKTEERLGLERIKHKQIETKNEMESRQHQLEKENETKVFEEAVKKQVEKFRITLRETTNAQEEIKKAVENVETYNIGYEEKETLKQELFQEYKSYMEQKKGKSNAPHGRVVPLHNDEKKEHIPFSKRPKRNMDEIYREIKRTMPDD